MMITTEEIINTLNNKNKFVKFEKFYLFFERAFDDVFIQNCEKYSEFLPKNSNKIFQDHPMYNVILNFKNLLETSDEKPAAHVKNIDDSFAIYFLGNWHLNSDNQNILLMKNILLFREAVNILGWEYIEIYKEYHILPLVEFQGEYSVLFLPDDVPQITDNYLACYLNFEQKDFPIKKVYISTFIIDFCHFIFELDLTNYKIQPLVDP